jgi:hypothetical protein
MVFCQISHSSSNQQAIIDNQQPTILEFVTFFSKKMNKKGFKLLALIVSIVWFLPTSNATVSEVFDKAAKTAEQVVSAVEITYDSVRLINAVYEDFTNSDGMMDNTIETGISIATSWTAGYLGSKTGAAVA